MYYIDAKFQIWILNWNKLKTRYYFKTLGSNWICSD